ncbi:MAG: hypothetical protein J0I16_22875 [Rhizobiales bacterium]|nr:hypothetical protein [Hyphomicrobiales bacterium]
MLMRLLPSMLSQPLLRGWFAACLLCTSATAGVPADAAKKIDALYEKFEQRIKVRQAEGTMPTLGTPADAELLNAFWNPALVGEAPYGAVDSEALITILAKQRSILSAYVFFPHASAERPPLASNILTFQDEIVRAQIVQLKIVGALAAVATDVSVLIQDRQMSDVKRFGISSFKVAYAPFLQNVNEIIALPGLRMPNRSALAKTLAENLARIAPALAQRDRLKIATQLKSSQSLLPESDRPEIDTALEQFLAQPCTGICAIR